MSVSEPQGQFELVFQGVEDGSERSLQRIKGVFVADFEMPTSEVQRIIESAPVCIKSAQDRSELETMYQALKRAGARVLIVRRSNKAEEGSELEFVDSGPQEELQVIPVKEEEPLKDEIGFEFALDEHELEDTPKIPLPKPKQPKVYTLEIDEQDDAPLFESGTLKLTSPPSPSAPDDETPLLSLLDTAEREHFEQNKGKSPVPPLIKEPSAELEASTRKDKASEESPGAFQPELSFEVEAPTEPEKPPEIAAPEPEEEIICASSVQSPEKTAQFEPKLEAPLPDAAPEPEAKPPPPLADDAKETEASLESPRPAAPSNAAPLMRARPRRRLPVDIVIPILVGSAILLGVNWYYFYGNGSNIPIDSLELSVQDILLEEQMGAVPKGTAKAVSTEDFTIVEGSLEHAEWSLIARFTLSQGSFKEGAITVNGKQPPPLTKEQIVRNEKLPTWVRRLELSDFQFNPTKEGLVEGKGVAIAYISVEGQHEMRVAGNASISLVYEEPVWKLTATAKNVEHFEALKDPEINVNLGKDGRYNFKFFATATLRPLTVN